MGDWSTVAQGFAIGAFPWISQFKALKIHFLAPSIDVAGVSNFFASLLAVSVFAYLQYAHPIQAIELPPWWHGIAAAGFLIVAFVSHFIYMREKVAAGKYKWCISLHLVLYVLIFVLLTAGFGTLKLLENHYLLLGRIKTQEGRPVPQADVRLVVANGDLLTESRSDANGEYRLLIDKAKAGLVRKVEVIAEGYVEYGKQVSDVAQLLSGHREIWMRKPPQK